MVGTQAGSAVICRYVTMGRHMYPSKVPFLNTWFLGPTTVYPPDSISISLAILYGWSVCSTQTEIHTDVWCVAVYWIYAMHAMWPNNMVWLTVGIAFSASLPSVLQHCWLGGRKGIRPVKNWAVGCWHGYLSGARCKLAYVPADATATHCLLLQ